MKDLEGPKLQPFSLPAHDLCFLFNIHYQQDMVFPATLVVLRLHLPLDRLTRSAGPESFVGS